jgi:hypothetical protein
VVTDLSRGLFNLIGSGACGARATRIDSTVVEADIRYPTDAELALRGFRALAGEGRKLRAAGTGCATARVRSRALCP